MSRSFKHSGFIQDQSGKKFGKRFANKRVRRSNDVPSGKRYRRIYQSYDIADYILQSRGELDTTEHRPGRKFKRIRLDKMKKSPWSFLDEISKDEVWKDWNK